MSQRIFITRKIPQPGIDLLFNKNFNVEIFEENKPIPKEVLIEKVKRADALLPLLTDTISTEVMEAARNLKIIANYAVGYNNIDLEEANRRKIVVTNTPGILTEATADLTWALIMSAAKRIVEADDLIRRGESWGWAPMFMLGAEVSCKTLGIIGAGRIGTSVAKRATGFDMKILYTANRRKPDIENLGGKKVDLDTLFIDSDFISVHVPLNDSTFHLIDENRLKQMKKSAFLINTSRGPVVDEQALVKALSGKWIAGAGLDVYENEPALAKGLADLENVVLLPHIGSATMETRTKMAIMTAENIIAFFEGRQPPNMVNSF